VEQITRDFYIPLVRMRSRKNGYAVSLIKAGAEIIGRSAGAVRPPLSMPSEAELGELNALIAKNRN
jgi:5-dehydro-4-deoxyglucarate dehydratase